MLINGEKWACEACVRGHRVSNCQHSDRPLTHINKKGRPVSQCPHCRGLRKARASHVKCECGEKPHSKDECPDVGLQKDRAEANTIEASLSAGIADVKTCCCTHGSRCTCALKKEYLDSVPETCLPKPSPASLIARKPRLQSTNSETSLTHFTNGHHKPVHKHNDAHNKLGTPYKIPIPHSISGNHDIGRKSSDSLPLSKTLDYVPSFHDSFTSAQQEVRQVKSEHGSPKPKTFPRFSGLDNPLPPLDLSYPAYLDTIGSPLPDDYLNDGYPRKPYESYLTSHDDAPVMSPALSMPAVDWTALDLGTSASYSQPPSYASFERNLGAAALSSSSSGGVSDFDEYMPRTAPTHPLLGHGEIPHSAPGNCNRQDTTSSFLSQPPSDILSASTSPNSLDMDEFNPPKTTATPTEFEDPSAPMSSEKFVKHGLTVQDVQKLAHPNNETPTEQMGELNLPNTIENKRRMPWAIPFDQEEAIFTPDGDGGSSIWTR
ncbi:MAG: hypothetical protein L6R42_001685 [Xanthoria sp. 1 TBL-2021]|nr:MAG: hypothetical protein L6R42_001685 [Xanthoria sp. 1 TBL-2021]